MSAARASAVLGWLTRYRQVWDERLDRFGAALANTPGPAGRGTPGRKRT